MMVEHRNTGHDVRPEDTEPIERYTLRERVMHWLNGLTYVYLLATGLALFSPHLYWIAMVLGGGPTVRYWHPWAGLLFMAGMLWMHSMWRGDMRAIPADREWNRKVRLYIENRDDELPPVGRFNPGQKQFYWVMWFGMILLLLSGILMWFPEYVHWNVRWLRPLVVMLHEIGALITVGAFIVHVYMGVFAVPGGLHAILHGYVSRGWAKAHHRLWYDRISGSPRVEP
jgi:formate dehydrogenase subunit gamma